MSNVNGKSGTTLTESKTTGTVGNFSHGSRETPATSVSSMEADRSEKARGHKSDTHVAGESDSSIVPGKPANNGGVPLPAESAEGRELTKGNAERTLLVPDSVPGRRDMGLLGIREAAEKSAFDRQLPKVGAVCGSSARTDLCGGRSAMTVPTAIVFNWSGRTSGVAIIS